MSPVDTSDAGPTCPAMPTWLRVLLIVLHVLAVAGGLWLGNETYERWSAPDVPEPLGLVAPEPTTS